jgi:hypothetical protein
MAIIKKNIEVTTTFTLMYDHNSPEFMQAFKDYKECIDKDASIKDMLFNVSGQIMARGIDDMIEGVGYVQRHGREEKDKKKLELFSGIWVEDDSPNSEYSVI